MADSKREKSRSALDARLLQINNKPLKFYLDGYNAYEFHQLAKIIEAYGGRLTLPDQETIIFAERDRAVQKYYYRYDVKFIHDCMVMNRMLDIQRYLLPAPPIPHMMPAPIIPKIEDLQHLKSSPKIHQPQLPKRDLRTPESSPSFGVSSDEELSQEELPSSRNSAKLRPPKCDTNVSKQPGPKLPHVICISDDESEPPLVDTVMVDLGGTSAPSAPTTSDSTPNPPVDKEAKRRRLEYLEGAIAAEAARLNLISRAASDLDEGRGSSFSSKSSPSGTSSSSFRNMGSGSPKRGVARKSTTKNGDVVKSGDLMKNADLVKSGRDVSHLRGVEKKFS